MKKNNVMRIPTQQQFLNAEKGSIAKTTDVDGNIAKKVIVLEPEDLIFTIQNTEIAGQVPNLVFERVGEKGKMVTQYLYLNQSYKPFLLYLCQNFEVILYSRLKTGLLNQLLSQIKAMVPGLKFSAVVGASCWLNTKLICENPDYVPRSCSNFSEVNSNLPKTIEINIKLKNVEKIFKKRGRDNVIFIDNNVYSYVNWLENYIPVPKFVGKENSCLFFLRFFLEDSTQDYRPPFQSILEGLDEE